jgi:hypothetical protein
MIAQRQFNGSWGNTAMSNELDDLLGLDTDDWIEHASSVLFDGRLLVTISPQMSAQGVFFRGLAVMDFNPVTSLRKKGSPCWEGIWTGWYPAAGQAPALGVLKLVTATVNNQERCFMYVLNSSSQIELWELSTEDKFDQGNSQVPIPWQVELPSYTCGDGDRFKTLEAGRMLVSAVSGQFYYNCQYRTDEWPCWVGWQSGTCCSQNQDCGPFLCTGPKVYLDQPRRPIRLAQPPDDFNKVTNILNRCGYEIQPRLQLVGYAAIKDFKVFCRDTTDMLSVDRSDDEICSSVTVGPPGQSVTYLTDAFGNYLTDAYGNRLTK